MRRAGRVAIALLVLAAVAGLTATGPMSAGGRAPWPAPGSPPLPPDLTVPYLPGVGTICAEGRLSCFHDLEAALARRTEALGCDHDAIFADAYLTITRALIDATTRPGFFDRPDRITHEARQYAQEYFDEYDRWHSGDRAGVAGSWRIALQAAHDESVTGVGDLLLQLNAHIRRDNPIRAVEQAEGVLRVEGDMPAASGRRDHDQVSEALQSALEHMLDRLAERYDPTIDDGADLFGTVADARGLYSLISTWREESWRNAEQLRHARAADGIEGPLYRAKLAQIEESASSGARAILEATRTTPGENARRYAFCAARRDERA
jgi:hypothetical protein